MGNFSPIHWFIVVLTVAPLLALMLVPAWRILQRAGYSGAWALLMLIPVVGFFVLWVLAFVKWPSDKDGRTRTSVPAIVAGVLLLPLSIGAIVAMSRSSVRQVATLEQGVQPAQQGVTPAKPEERIDWEKGVFTPPLSSK